MQVDVSALTYGVANREAIVFGLDGVCAHETRTVACSFNAKSGMLPAANEPFCFETRRRRAPGKSQAPRQKHMQNLNWLRPAVYDAALQRCLQSSPIALVLRAGGWACVRSLQPRPAV